MMKSSQVMMMAVELVVPHNLRADRRVAFIESGVRYTATVPRGLHPGAPFVANVPITPLVSREAPLPALTLSQYVHNARRASRLKRKHTHLKRSGALDTLTAQAQAAHAAALEEAACAYEQGLPGAHVASYTVAS